MELLFVYGTLLLPKNSFGRYLRNNSSFISGAKLKGQLFDIGAYPGAVFNPASATYVHGALVRLNKSAVIDLIDDYEGFGEKHEKPNEFIRKLVVVETQTDQETCWFYEYNLPVKMLTPITSGKYLEYLS